MSLKAYVVLAGAFAGLGSFLFGYDTGIITTSIAHTSFLDYMGHPNAAMTGAIVAAFIAGEAIGALLQMSVGDKFGRRRFMQALCILVTIGTIIQTAATSYGMFLAGRILTGIAVGGLIGTVTVYNSEISPPEYRGFIAGLPNYMLAVGGCLANWIGYACGFAPQGNIQWRIPLCLQIPPGVLLFIGLQYFLPESPRWLIRQGRDAEAEVMFRKIRGEVSVDEFETMKGQILYEKSVEISTFAEAWQKYRKRIIIAVAVQSMTSLSGVNVINYFQTTLYEQLGFVGQKVLLLSAIYGTIGTLVNIVSLYLLDRVGRVKLLGGGALGLSVILIYDAIMTKFFATSNNKIGKDFTVLGIFLYTAMYYLGINSTSWLYGVEILPIFLRSKVTGLAAFSHFVFNIAINEAGPSAFANIKQNYYYVFAAMTLLSGIMVFMFFPETKGRTLEMIAADFGDVVVGGTNNNEGQAEEKTYFHEERVENANGT